MILIPPEQIRLLRFNRGMTQQQLAQYLGAAVTTIARWEEGKTDPMPVFAERLQCMINDDQVKRAEAEKKANP